MATSIRTIVLTAATLLAVAQPYAAFADGPTTKPTDPARRQKAVELLAKAESFPVPKDGTGPTGGELVEARVRLGDLAEARRRLDEIGDNPLWKYTPAESLARAQRKAGDAAGAKATLASIPEPMNGSEKDYGLLQAAAGDFDGAEKTSLMLSKMPEPAYQAQVLVALAQEEFSAGKVEQSDLHFAKAADALTHCDAWEKAVYSTGWIASQRDVCGDHAGAQRTLKSDSDAGDALEWSVSLATASYAPPDKDKLVDLLGRLRKQLDAEAGIKDDGTNPLLPLRRMGRWRLLANGWIAVGDNAKAIDAVSHEEQLVDSFKGAVNSEPMLLAFVAPVLAHAGDRAGALRRIDHATEVARTLKADPATQQLWQIACTEAGSPLADDAPRVIQMAIKSGTVDPITGGTSYISSVASALATRQGVKADLSWIDTLPTDEEKAAAYAGAAVGMLGDAAD